MPGPFSSTTDLFITPILNQLSVIINAQISPPPSVIYTLPPDGQPENNSVVITAPTFEDVGATEGLRELRFHFNVIHFTDCSMRIGDDIQNCYNWLSAYLNVFDAWANQSLQDVHGVVNSREVTLTKGRVTKLPWGATSFIVLFMNLDVITEYAPYTGS